MYFKFSISVFKSEYLVRELLFEVLKAIQAYLLLFVNISGRLWSRFTAQPRKSQHQKVFINFWDNSLSTGNSEQGPPLVCMLIHFLRKHSSMLLPRIFLFAKKPIGRMGVSFKFVFLKYTTMFNQRLEVVPASALFILCV